MHAASVIDARAPAAPLKSSLANRRHPRRRPAVVARGRAFDANDPLTWNANADDDAGMDFDSTEDVGVANLQELSDADLAALGPAGATTDFRYRTGPLPASVAARANVANAFS